MIPSKPQVNHSPEENENYIKAHAYMNAYVDSLVDEYKVKKENAYLTECVDKLVFELRGIKDELTEIKEQNAVLAERVSYLDITRLTVAMGNAVPPVKAKKTIEELFEEDEFQHTFGHKKLGPSEDILGPASDAPETPKPRPAAQTGTPKPKLRPIAKVKAPEPGPDPPEDAEAAEDAQPVSEPLQKTKKQKKEKQKKPSKTEKKPKNKVVAIASNVLFYLCMALLILGAVTFAQSDDINKSLFGFRYYYIKTASMEPVYPVGSVVFTKVTPPEEIDVGDDITVYIGDGSTASYLTHRVVEVVTDGGALAFRTKGVNNKSNDPTPYSAELVVGKVVFCIPILGTVMTFVQTQLIFVIGIFVLLLLLSFMLKILFKKEPEIAEKEAETV